MHYGIYGSTDGSIVGFNGFYYLITCRGLGGGKIKC